MRRMLSLLSALRGIYTEGRARGNLVSTSHWYDDVGEVDTAFPLALPSV